MVKNATLIHIMIKIDNNAIKNIQRTSITSEFEQAYKQWKAGNITAVEAMKQSNMKNLYFIVK